MPRAANRLSPLPVDGAQLEEYLSAVCDASQQGAFSLADLAAHCHSEVTKPNGESYRDSNLKQVIRNLARLGFFIEDGGSFSPNPRVVRFLEGSFKPRSDRKGHDQIPLLGHLLIECMEDLGISELDPYIADQLSYFFDTIRKNPNEEWTNSKILERTSDEADPKHGFRYKGLTAAHLSRIPQEYLKLLGIIGVIQKDDGRKFWKPTVNADAQEYVRKRLSDLRFQKYLENLIREIGAEHPYLANTHKHIFFRRVGRYITYRYSGGSGAQGGLRTAVMGSLGSITEKLQKEYKVKKGRAYNAEKPRALISLMREWYVDELTSRVSGFDDLERLKSALRAMSLHELTITAEKETDKGNLANLLRSRGTGRYSRLTLKRLQHQEGRFSLPSALVPYDWQSVCMERWAIGDPENGRPPFTGIASAVTGTGKTVMALMAASRFVESHPEAIVSVVVPSKVLMTQWAEEAAKFLGLGPDDIGFVGDGFSDSFSEGRRMIIWIVNSAVKDKRMQNDLDSVDESIPHLLIADECHEYGGDSFRLFLESRAEGRLAISATPPDTDAEGDRHPVLNTMGHIFYRLGYRKAHSEGLISDFRLKYLGIDLTPEERAQYDRLSDEIRRLLRELEEMYGPQLEGPNLFARLKAIRKAEGGNATITLFQKAVDDRKDTVRNAINRDTASVATLKQMQDEGQEDYTMLWFHEQINETTRLVSDANKAEWSRRRTQLKDAIRETKEKGGEPDSEMLSDLAVLEFNIERLTTLRDWFMMDSRVRPGMYHSKFPNPWGKWMVDWFRHGYLNVMLSAKALAQGFDMPGADVGNIRTSSSNVRQRIQTIGRLIRKKEEGRGAVIWIIYVKDTIDERIFEKHDWEEELPEYPPDEDEENQVQTRWELNDYEKVLDARPKFVGGVETLPQPDRELTDDELQEIDVAGLVCGDDYPDRRAIRSTLRVVRVSEEGEMSVIDEGAPFDFNYESLGRAASWFSSTRGRGQIHVLGNGHAVGRAHMGRVVLLEVLDLSDFERAVADSIESGSKFDEVFKDWLE